MGTAAALGTQGPLCNSSFMAALSEHTPALKLEFWSLTVDKLATSGLLEGSGLKKRLRADVVCVFRQQTFQDGLGPLHPLPM